ncbi:ribonuclease D [Chloroflexota bacterium]
MNLPVEVIHQSGQLDTAVQEIVDSRAIALDTESNSRHRNPEQLCLIQIATLQKVYIIDTLLIGEITPLRGVLSDSSITKVIHGADYDILSLARHYGFSVRNIYDTTIAARFIGITKFGLAALIEDLLGIKIEKSARLQKADWGLRPLSVEALEYAATDVRYLLALRKILNQRLQTLKRMTWVTEECTRLEELRYKAPDVETAYLSVKGASKLDGRNLAVLRALFLFREEEALRQHRPPYFVMPESTVIYLANNPTADLSKAPGLGQNGLKRFGRGLRWALNNGMASPPINRPQPIKIERATEEQVQRLSRLKEWRTSLSSSLSLDPYLIWPLTSLKRLAKAPNTLSNESISNDIRHWQRDAIASSLQACLESLY